ncbi:MAG: zinc ribbon domain-containing protein [Nitrospirae bacterium]|nr:zinc ribbon domain-containing protein [Nitrospirota bacterium]
MICPKCHFEQPDGGAECIRCGVLFAKWKPSAEPVHAPVQSEAAVPLPEPTMLDVAKAWLCTVEESVNPFYFAGRALVWLGLAAWGWQFIRTPVKSDYWQESFMHGINLPFHEAGHLIFSPFGEFMTVLGGSLFQVLMPLICAGTFLLKNRDPFGTSVGVWWAAQSLMDVSPYINDARDLEMVLLGGVTGRDVEDYHDWERILRWLDLLPYDHRIAAWAKGLGSAAMILALVWGAYVLVLQYRRLDRS